MINEALLVAQNLVRTFGEQSQSVTAVNDVSINLNRGELLVIEGASGSGKSTLLALLSGLLRPTSGSVSLMNTDIWSLNDRERRDCRWKNFGFVFQGFNLFRSLTALEQLELVLTWGSRISRKEARRNSMEVLDMLGLKGKDHLLPDEMSGGEKQRVAIGRALVKRPSFLFADEPTSALDWERGKSIVEIIRNAAHDRGMATLLVSHDVRILPFADRVIRMEDGKIVA